MFLNGSSGYSRHGEQTAKGDFLIVFSDKANNLRAAVRHVRMRQCGHFMIGSARLGPHRVELSGSYGSDGLPLRPTKNEPRLCWTRIGESEHWHERTYEWEAVPTVKWESLIFLPEELQREFWHPERQGWNSCGSEAKNLKKWALENLKQLKNAGK